MEDIVDISDSNSTGKIHETVKVLGILSIVGSALFILLCIWYFSQLDMIAQVGMIGGAAEVGAVMSAMKAVLFAFIAVNALTIFGIVKVLQGKGWGFILYAILNSLWGLMFILASTNVGIMQYTVIIALIGVTSIGFVVGLGLQMKNMPK